MGNQYNFQSLRDSGRGLDEVAEELRAEWEKLKTESQDFEGIFGDGQDDVGGILRMLYEVVHGMADESMVSAVQNFKGIGQLLTDAGDRHQETEDANTEILKTLKATVDDVQGGGA